jgi:uncharacterized protein (DUF302 family)
MTHAQESDPVEYASPVNFDQTLERLVNAIKRAGMTVFATIDHAAGARDAGMTMPPTTVLIYGNPKGGTPIMLAAPLVALDLPLRVLLREGADGQTLISFHPAAHMLRRAGVPAPLSARLDAAQLVLMEALRS